MNGVLTDGGTLASDLTALMANEADTNFEMAVCPPFTLIAAVADAIAGSALALGAQDCHPAEKGPHTGDVSTAMLADLGCRFVIVGHSERRTDHAESDADVQAKAAAVQAQGMAAIICIGETEDERDGGKTLEVVRTQLAGSVPGTSSAENTVIAYEPVWAIGTGRTPSLDEVQEVHALIRAELTSALGAPEADGIRILYGGSMKPDNASDLLALEDVDGGLIGGASLKAEDFWAIGQSCV
jgi:triosephosphate isomerase